jgi:hypothetical protein
VSDNVYCRGCVFDVITGNLKINRKFVVKKLITQKIFHIVYRSSSNDKIEILSLSEVKTDISSIFLNSNERKISGIKTETKRVG